MLRPVRTRTGALKAIAGLTAILVVAAMAGGSWSGVRPAESNDAAGQLAGSNDPLTDAPFMDMVAALRSGSDTPPGAAVALALRGVADAHGVAVPPRDDCPSLAAAIGMHAERFDLAVVPPVPFVPALLDEALACLLAAVHAANLAMDRTFAGISAPDVMKLYDAAREERPLDATLMALLEDRDHAHNLVAAIHAAEAVDHALPLLRAAQAGPLPLPPLDLEPILRFTPAGDEYYDRNYALIVDLEGNDVYDNHAGGVFVAIGSGIWDVEEGSEYLGTNVLGQNVAVGGNVQDADTVISSSMVLDLAGDDTYGVKKPPTLKDLSRGCTDEELVTMVGTAGGGVIGVGMLFDLGGDDTFIGRTGTQGSGHIFGVGVLYSGGGHDTFEAIRLAQGSGLLGGIGLLINAGGDNSYLARPPAGGAWNGDILICDEDSRYVQGSAFDRRVGPALPSVGILADLDGDTSYQTIRKGQGFGQGPGLGLLYDQMGDDTYHAVELSQGAAQGRNKDTHPQAPWGSGYAVLFDEAGGDAYTLEGAGQGWRGQGYSLGQPDDPPEPTDINALIQWAVDRSEAIGLLYDAAGQDSFSGPPGRDNDATNTDGILGIFHSTSPSS